MSIKFVLSFVSLLGVVTRYSVLSSFLLPSATAQQSAPLQHATSSDCPKSFYHLVLPADARTCHLFNDSLPASLTFHSTLAPLELARFMRKQITEPVQQSMAKQRILIRSQGGQNTVVISHDGAGSQVDVLIKTGHL